uniref:Cation/H+ exchanger transmembrane domain-containing protein n=1 Tax=Chrysotila carterae TaxID=13221 RepID=A0A7S4AYE0_CHRCT
MTEPQAREFLAGEGYSEAVIEELIKWGCPAKSCVRHWDILPVCEAEHSPDYTLYHHEELHWPIAFLSVGVLLGAFNRWILPKAMPYTVGLLIQGVIIGVIAEALHDDPKCPLAALDVSMYDVNRNNKIERTEWDHFNCQDCVVGSKCQQVVGCGDDCYNFDELDGTFRLTLMDTARIDDIADNGSLEPDELWTARCNLLRDLVNTADMAPHLLLLIFLPVLLFESAFSIDIGLVSAQFSSIVLLAFPGVVVASLLSALTIMLFSYLTPLGMLDFNAAWLIGTIISATDPVAVVALLKELGAPKTLAALIEGESLMNDGSAVVLYTFLFTWVEYGNDPPVTGNLGLEFLLVIGQMLVYGVLFGLVAGKVAAFMLRRLHNDMLAELSLIVGASYFIFWLCEVVMLSSSVLATVVFGFYLNKYRAAISADAIHFIEQVYKGLGHFFNTIIFLIAGVKLGIVIVEYRYFLLDPQWSVTLFFPVALAFMWVAVILVRFTTVALFFPILRLIGLGLSWQQAVILCWGGLRGAVSLALSVAVSHHIYSQETFGGPCVQRLDGSLPCRDTAFFTLYITLLVVLSTVTINGPTVAVFLDKLELTKLTDERKFMVNNATSHLADETSTLKERFSAETSARGENHHNLIKWDLVEEHSINRTHVTTYEIEDMETAAWREAIHLERSSYFEQLERGEMGEVAFETLETMLSVVEAQANQRAGHAELIALYLKISEKIIERLDNADGVGGKTDVLDFFSAIQLKAQSAIAFGAKRKLQLHFHVVMLNYEMALAWCKAQDHVHHALNPNGFDEFPLANALNKFDKTGNHVASKHRRFAEHLGVERLRQRKHDQANLGRKRDIYLRLRSIRQQQLRRMHAQMAKLKESPIDARVITATQTLRATRVNLVLQKNMVKSLMAEGEMTDLDGEKLVDLINKKMKQLHLKPSLLWAATEEEWASLAVQEEQEESWDFLPRLKEEQARLGDRGRTQSFPNLPSTHGSRHNGSQHAGFNFEESLDNLPLDDLPQRTAADL